MKAIKPENIGDQFTKQGIKKLAVGQVLTFLQNGERKEYKIVRRHLRRQEIWVRPIQLYSTESIVDKDKV